MENVYPFRPRLVHRPLQTRGGASAFDDLTDAIILSRAAAGTLDPAIVAALLVGVREARPECGR